jgi:NAD(P)-dependent dehydrogenase (short-subunit alcohol dehydrogenase family)
VINATGFLHNESIMPERSLRDLSLEKFQQNFLINTIGPALVAKYFTPKLRQDKPSVFASLSARVGSIGDNKLGGWYSYRSSKAAHNMMIKNVSIEVSRRNKQAAIIGLHPGTVDSNLSKLFQKRVAKENLFSPDYSAKKLIQVIESVSSQDSGKILAWDGGNIEY